MEKYNIYKLLNNKRPASWQLPLSNVMIEKFDKNGNNLGHRAIKYVPGEQSFFEEDIKGSRPGKDIWFEKGEIAVLKADKMKNKLMQSHPWYGKHYELYSAQNESKKQLAIYRAKDEAIKLIEESDEDKINAISLAVFGQRAFSWDSDTCELELRKYADKKPEKLQRELNSKDYESKYISALAISKGVIKTNSTKSDIIWNDTTEGVILRLAKGENAVDKLGEFLSTRTDESERVLQEIGLRVKKIEISSKKSNKDVEKVISEKDKEIALLKEQLSKLSGDTEPTTDIDLEEVTLEYISIFDKEPPPRYKNDAEWISKKIKESK